MIALSSVGGFFKGSDDTGTIRNTKNSRFDFTIAPAIIE
jgi:hypothetical protein